MFAKVLCLALCVAVATAQTGGWKYCEGNVIEVTEVSVQGCSATPCTFIKGNTYDIEVQAEADRVTGSLPYTLSVKLGGADIPITEGDACDFLVQGSCPTSVGASFRFSKGLEITNTLPDMKSTARAVVKDDKDQVAICVEFDFETRSA